MASAAFWLRCGVWVGAARLVPLPVKGVLAVADWPSDWPSDWLRDDPIFTDFYRIFTEFSDFLGRLQPSKTTIQKTLDALGVEESSSPRRVLHF